MTGTATPAASHIEAIRAALEAAVGPVSVFTRRGRRIDVDAVDMEIGRASVVLGFSGRYAYGGLDRVVAR